MSSLRRPTSALDSWLEPMAQNVRQAVSAGAERDLPVRVAGCVSDLLPPVEILTVHQRAGSAQTYQQHVLHVDPLGRFSIAALVWRPGQATSIHDHVCWCVVGVLAGIEHETRYELHDDSVVAVGQLYNLPGSVSAVAPPGDIHRVRNAGSDVAISLHVYGADIAARGTSIRRNYERPKVLPGN
jgi:predicted metal-dependent enzyme (double-stranded beta helix superfamily)